jgi:hypothetical protein
MAMCVIAIVGVPVPVLLPRRKPDNVVGPDVLFGPRQRCAQPQSAVTIKVWPADA